MSRIVLLATAIIAVSSAMTDASAQISKKCKSFDDRGRTIFLPAPHKSIRPHRQMPINVSYDALSTVLIVNFPQSSEENTVEVYSNGLKVTGITASGGTTFSCVLYDYGVGDYNIIVRRENTVVYSKNVSVR